MIFLSPRRNGRQILLRCAIERGKIGIIEIMPLTRQRRGQLVDTGHQIGGRCGLRLA
jgi:hypothetical protein